MAAASSQFPILLFFNIILCFLLLPADAVVFNVKSFGAVGDGVTDDTQAFVDAWQQFCKSQGATLLIPGGNTFMIGMINFAGECQPGLVFQVDGTIIAPGPDSWPTGSRRDPWIFFEEIHGMQLQGNGIIDGRGQNWWELPCKHYEEINGTTQSNSCDNPPTIKFSKSSTLIINGLKIKNSPQFHIKFVSCEDVHIESLTIETSSDSPNTDGIHLEKTNGVHINNSIISNGDDCISIGAYVYNVHINNLTCGPSHGISIGSLGDRQSYACVSNITVTNSIIKESVNGVRIKTWQGGSGSVFNITFRDIYVENVRYPIVIDQYYCSTEKYCNDKNAIMISDILYENIRGTYGIENKKSIPIQFDCSDVSPCTNLKLAGIELHPVPGQMIIDPFCQSARGKTLTSTIPAVNCLDGRGFPYSTKHSC